MTAQIARPNKVGVSVSENGGLKPWQAFTAQAQAQHMTNTNQSCVAYKNARRTRRLGRKHEQHGSTQAPPELAVRGRELQQVRHDI